jgi:hypothetical protein
MYQRSSRLSWSKANLAMSFAAWSLPRFFATLVAMTSSSGCDILSSFSRLLVGILNPTLTILYSARAPAHGGPTVIER